jgi:hypothetical protein
VWSIPKLKWKPNSMQMNISSKLIEMNENVDKDNQLTLNKLLSLFHLLHSHISNLDLFEEKWHKNENKIKTKFTFTISKKPNSSIISKFLSFTNWGYNIKMKKKK